MAEGQTSFTTGERGPLPMDPVLSERQASDKLAERWAATEESGHDDQRHEGDSDVTREPERQARPPRARDVDFELDPLGLDDDTSSQMEAAEDPLDGVGDADAEHGGDLEPFRHLDDIVDAAGYDKNTFMSNLHVPVRVGEDEFVDVNLHELVQGYQRGARHRDEMGGVEQARTQLEAREEQARQQWAADFDALRKNTAFAAAVLEDNEKRIKEHFDGVNWTQLRQEDQGAYAAAQADYKRALDTTREQREQLAREYSEAEGIARQRAEQQQQQYIEKERKALLKVRPEWRDEERRTKDGQEMAQYLGSTYGVTPQEMSTFYDHRLLDLVHKAMMFDRARKKTTKAPDLPRRNGGLLRPGASQQGRGLRPTRNRKQAEDSRARLSRTHRQADAANALADRWAAAEEAQSRR